MDIQIEREAFENKFPVPAHWIDFDGLTCKYICKYNAIDDQALKYQARWEAWLAAKAQSVPEGFVLAPVEEVKTWYLDDDESIYREDSDWLCNTPVGEVVEVERRISYELDQASVFAAITWDEDNQDVGYYETFATKDEAEKAAAHCKTMIEAQEQKG